VARIETIADADDARVAAYRDLQDAAHAARQGLFVVESRGVVRLLVDHARFHARSLLVTRPALEALRDVIAGLEDSTPVYLAPQEIVRRIVGFHFHRGCLALGERGLEPPLDALLAPPGPRLVLVLERLANPDNVVGIFRNAMAFGVDAVLLSPGCTDPLSRKAIRVSAGGVLATPFVTLDDWPAALTRVREAGFVLLALTPLTGAVEVAELGVARPIPRRVALLVGNEGDGLSAAARSAADLEVTIAMAPGVDSLNVATAAAIALHRVRAAR